MNIRLSAAALSFAACISTQNPTDPSQSASTLALSRDDAFLYAVDTDNSLLAVIDTKSETKIADVKVGAGASRVVVGKDDVVYVTNRLDHSLSVVTRGTWSEARKIEAGAEPVGLAASSDGQTLYVVSAVAADTARHGTLLAIDAKSGTQKWTVALGEEPRGITLTDDAHAVVTLLKQGDLQFVDLARQAVAQTGTDAYAKLNASANSSDSVHPRGLEAVAVMPDRSGLFAMGNLARESGAGWGGCAAQLIDAPAIMQFDTHGVARVDDILNCTTDAHLPTVISDGSDEFTTDRKVIQGPAAIAMERTGEYAYIAAQQSDNVVIAHTGSGRGIGGSSTVAVVKVGSGPNGIAVTHLGTRAYVLNAFDHSVSVLKDDGSGNIVRAKDIVIAADTLSADAVAGRKLFFDATNPDMAGNAQGAACATCHLDNGREDGHVWTFAEGRRQTMSLAGGRLDGTAPFHWDGAFDTLATLMDHTTKDRMGGTGPSADMEQQIGAYLATLPAPINPKTASERGAEVFTRAQCGSCHLGPKLTNNTMANVGTGDGASFNVPSLIGIARTAPYLHDGSAKTLEERIRLRQSENLHGLTADLSDQDVADLVDYLETL